MTTSDRLGSRLSLAIATIVVFVLLGSRPAAAAWTSDGLPITTASANQASPRMVPDGSGGALIAWTDDRVGEGGVFLTRVTSDGELAVGWPVGGVRVDSIQSPYWGVVEDGSGGAFVLWQDLEGFRVHHYGADGGVFPGWPPSGISYSMGGANGAIKLGCFSSDGRGGVLYHYVTVVTPTSYVSTLMCRGGDGGGRWSVTVPGSIFQPDLFRVRSVAPDFAGGAYVAYEQDSNPPFTIQRFDSTGALAAGWASTGTRLYSTGPVLPVLLPDSALGLFVVWTTIGPLTHEQLLVDHIKPDGTLGSVPWQPAGFPLGNDTQEQVDPFAVSDGAGGAMIAWQETPVSTGVPSVRAIHVSAAGGIGLQFEPALSPFDQVPTGLAPDGSGGAIVTWYEDKGTGFGPQVRVQRLDHESPLWSEGGVPVCTSSAPETEARIVRSGADVLLAWEDWRQFEADHTFGSDIYAAKLASDGTVGTLLALVRASATHERVELLWSSGSVASTATVQRSRDGVTWNSIGIAERRGSDELSFVDRAVAGAKSLAYRLVGADGQPMSAVTWVEIPRGSPLQLRGFVASSKWPIVSLTLATGAPARLDVFDAMGRTIQSLRIGDHSAGDQLVPLESGLPAGYYLLRLRQGALEVSRGGARWN
jgi:hypothetical protein